MEFVHRTRYIAVPIYNNDQWVVLSLGWNGEWKRFNKTYDHKFACDLATAMEFDAHNLDELAFCRRFCTDKPAIEPMQPPLVWEEAIRNGPRRSRRASDSIL